ncbi:transcriptional regulator [Chitinophaga tropicalis]|uniref:Transcriptional regulator n=1 Tax=Chitinophaga tropicalis TaxID=2683588 RepID=A0A7K1UCI2_9BACT|nr:transcriptional regulator [Chitinophaga tropicalis]MVT12016.1 transcriptional regulator [Chitinophaga tropicalis]
MTSVITGDIINSRKMDDPAIWLNPLKALMREWGKSPKTWEIYRGDSFQVEINAPQHALLAAIRIKACIKSIEKLDVRIGIGIGEKNYDAPKITEANGEVFINSGEIFEELKKLKQHLAIRSPWPELDNELNLMLRLASIVLDKWSAATAQIVAASIVNRNLSQKELGDRIERTQSTISETQKRAHYDEIMDLIAFYEKSIVKKIS